MSDFEFKKVEGGYSLSSYDGKFKKVVIPDTFQGEPVVEIREGAFEQNNTCYEIALPDTVKIIRSNAFCYCSSLKKVVFSENLKEIEGFSFFRCHSLQTLLLPSSLECVGQLAFCECKVVTILAENKNTIFHKETFKSCEYLREVSISVWKYLSKEQISRLVSLKLKVFFTLEKKEQKEILTFVKRRAYLKKSVLEGDVPEGISALLRSKIKLSLEDVNDFLDISVKEARTEITAMFLDYKNKNFTQEEIEALNQREDLVEMGLALPTFRELSKKWLCKKTKTGITIQGYLKSETKETIPKSLEDGTKIIDIRAYNDFSPLEELTILAELTDLSNYAFLDCHTLRRVHLPDTLKNVGNGCFDECAKLESITFPKGITKLPSSMFTSCVNLKEVNFPSSLMYIEEAPTHGFFFDCTSLEKVVLPPLLTEIQGGMFHNCISLKEIVIPDSVITIGNYAFAECKNLPPFTLPKSLKKIAKGAFMLCDSMVNEDGYILIHHILFRYKGEEPDIRIPEGVTTISDYALHGHEKLRTIHLPKSIKMIGSDAFNECYALHTVTFEDMEDCEVHFERWAIRGHASDVDKMSLQKITLPAKATYHKDSFEDFTVVTGGILIKDD